MDATKHKEAVLKECVQSWIDEAFTITMNIEGRLAHIRGMHINVEKHPKIRGLGTTDATDSTSSSSVHC